MKKRLNPSSDEALAALRRRLAQEGRITLPLSEEDLAFVLRIKREHTEALEAGISSESFFGERIERSLSLLRKELERKRIGAEVSRLYLSNALSLAEKAADSVSEVLCTKDPSEAWRFEPTTERWKEIALTLLRTDRALRTLFPLPAV